eukprot:116830-Prymnesium_polylepis.1
MHAQTTSRLVRGILRIGHPTVGCGRGRHAAERERDAHLFVVVPMTVTICASTPVGADNLTILLARVQRTKLES